jgi:hypothetical protein
VNREERLEYARDYHRRTYADRCERKNARRREQRKQTNWYENNREKIKTEQKFYYEVHRDEIRTKARQKSAELRAEVIQHYGGCCACCGETEIKFLAIDHLNGGGVAHRRKLGGGGQAIYRWIRNNSYPEGFQVLCHNCNTAKGLYGICPHQRRLL